jgi:hypothetical protein
MDAAIHAMCDRLNVLFSAFVTRIAALPVPRPPALLCDVGALRRYVEDHP